MGSRIVPPAPWETEEDIPPPPWETESSIPPPPWEQEQDIPPEVKLSPSVPRFDALTGEINIPKVRTGIDPEIRAPEVIPPTPWEKPKELQLWEDAVNKEIETGSNELLKETLLKRDPGLDPTVLGMRASSRREQLNGAMFLAQAIPSNYATKLITAPAKQLPAIATWIAKNPRIFNVVNSAVESVPFTAFTKGEDDETLPGRMARNMAGFTLFSAAAQLSGAGFDKFAYRKAVKEAKLPAFTVELTTEKVEAIYKNGGEAAMNKMDTMAPGFKDLADHTARTGKATTVTVPDRAVELLYPEDWYANLSKKLGFPSGPKIKRLYPLGPRQDVVPAEQAPREGMVAEKPPTEPPAAPGMAPVGPKPPTAPLTPPEAGKPPISGKKGLFFSGQEAEESAEVLQKFTLITETGKKYTVEAESEANIIPPTKERIVKVEPVERRAPIEKYAFDNIVKTENFADNFYVPRKSGLGKAIEKLGEPKNVADINEIAKAEFSDTRFGGLAKRFMFMRRKFDDKLVKDSSMVLLDIDNLHDLNLRLTMEGSNYFIRELVQMFSDLGYTPIIWGGDELVLPLNLTGKNPLNPVKVHQDIQKVQDMIAELETVGKKTGKTHKGITISGVFGFNWKDVQGRISDEVKGIKNIVPLTSEYVRGYNELEGTKNEFPQGQDTLYARTSKEVSPTVSRTASSVQGGKADGDIVPGRATSEVQQTVSPSQSAAEVTPPSPEPQKPTITDPRQVQEVRNSIAEGQLTLRTGEFNGRKLSPDELLSVRRQVEKDQASIGESRLAGKKIQSTITDVTPKGYGPSNPPASTIIPLPGGGSIEVKHIPSVPAEATPTLTSKPISERPPEVPLAEKPAAATVADDPIISTKKPSKTTDAVSAMKSIIHKGSKLPILQHVVVDSKGNMMATDLEVALTTKSNLAPGAYKIMGKNMDKTSLDPADFPALPETTKDGGTIERSALLDSLEKASKFSSEDETRHTLRGTYIEVKGGKGQIVGTDGRRMYFEPINAKGLKDGKYILPVVGGKVIAGMKAMKEGSIQLSLGENSLSFSDGDTTLSVRLIDGEYPKTAGVIPSDMKYQVILSKDQALAALKELAPYIKQAGRGVIMATKFSKESVEFTVGDPKSGGKSVSIPVKTKTVPAFKPTSGNIVMPMLDKTKAIPVTGINPAYLKDSLSVIDGDVVFWSRPESEASPHHFSGNDQSVVGAKAIKGAPKKAGGKGVSAAKGSTQIDKIEKVTAEGATAKEDFKLSEKIKNVAKKYADRIGETYNPRGTEGVFFPKTGNVYLNALNDIGVAVHETFHAMSKKYSTAEPLMRKIGSSKTGTPIYNTVYAKVRKKLTELYVEYYPGGVKTHKLETRMEEGLAILFQKSVESPSELYSKYPELVNMYLKGGGSFYRPIYTDMLADFRKVLGEYQNLSNLDKVGARMTNKFQQDEIKDSYLNFWDKIKSEIADNLYAIEKLAREAGVQRTASDPSLWARQYNNVNHFILNNINGKRGYWTYKNGSFSKDTDKSISDFVNELQKKGLVDNFSHWLIARRQHFLYQELDKLEAVAIAARERIDDLMKSPSIMAMKDIAELKKKIEIYRQAKEILKRDGFDKAVIDSAYEEGKATFTEFAKTYDLYNQSNLEMMADGDVGLITSGQVSRYSSIEGYASFKRDVYDDIIGTGEALPGVRVGKTKVSSLLGRKGSKLSIINPLYSLITDSAEIMRKSLRQMVYNKIGGLADQFPELFQKLPLEPSYDTRNGRITYPQEKDTNIIMARDRNGKRVPILVSKEIKKVVDELMSYQDVGIFEKLMKTSSRWFTKGTTGTYPLFAPTNFLIDQISAASQTRNKMIPIYDALKNISKALWKHGSKEAEFFEEYMVMGGERQTFVRHQDTPPEELFKILAKEKKGLDLIAKAIEDGLDFLSWPVKVSEFATRGTEYIKSRMSGHSQVVAMEDAGRVSVPFHHTGRWWGGSSLIKSIPFFNPGIQVLAQFGRTLGQKDTKNRALFVVAAITASIIGSFAYMMKRASKEQKQAYKDLEPNELANYLWLPHSDGKRLVKLRIPEQMGIIGHIINMALADIAMDAKYSAGDYAAGATAFLPDQFNVTDPTRVFFSWLPQLIKPLIGVATNTRDYPKVRPLEGKWFEGMEPRQRFNDNTSKFAKFMGDKLNLSPIKIDYLIEGYLGRVTRFVTGKPISNPFIRDWYFSAGRNLQDYYEMRDETRQSLKAIKEKTSKLSTAEKEKVHSRHGAITRIERQIDRYREMEKRSKPKEAEGMPELRTIILDGIGDLR